MKNLSPEICKKFKESRREAGMTQSELAREVGCKQSALSMFEQGDGTKINDEVIEKLAKKFGIRLAAEDASAAPVPPVVIRPTAIKGTAFCPNAGCPTNHPYLVDGRRFLKPALDEADPVGGKFCALCGELLERSCPNCGAPVHAGAVCSHCGEAYVASL